MKTDTGKSIDWAKVTFIFCDERLVPFDNPESTLGLYLNLFKDTDIKEEQFLKVAVDLDVESAAKVELVSKELNHFGVITGLFRQIGGHSSRFVLFCSF